ncbi:MAG: Gldg family protein [Deltaproteobacteria bacterium]|nr:Gldg family protein [Deltaproteobacteria bacterium]
MARVWTIFKREWRSYFNSPIAYIVVTILLVVIGYFFFQTFFLGGQATQRQFFVLASWSFALFAPAITMRLFAEERKSGTLEPLLTLPVREWEVVAGKFLAAWALLGVYLLLTVAYSLSIDALGDLDWGPVIGGYIGLFALGGTFIALGLFCSAVTGAQVVSLIVATAAGLLLLVLDYLLPFVPEGMQNFVQYLGAGAHFRNVARGLLDTRDLFYSGAAIAAFLFATVFVLRSRLTDHTHEWRLNRVLYLAGTLGAIGALAVVSTNVYARVDLTEDGLYTLSPASEKLVADLPDQVRVKVYASKNLPAPLNNHAAYLRDQLEEYRDAADGNFTYEFIDPDTAGADGKPDEELIAEARTAGIPKVEVNKLDKDEVQVVKVYVGLSIAYRDKVEAVPVIQNLNDLEFQISSRIAKMTRENAPTVGMASGFGMLTSAQGLSQAAQTLGEKYTVKDVDLSRGAAALADVQILVVAGPREKLSDAALVALDQFVMGGGKALFLVDRAAIDMQSFIGRPLDTGLTDLVENLGVRIEPHLVLDQQNQRVAMMRQQGNFRIQSYVDFPPFIRVRDMAEDTPVTKNLRDLTLTFASPVHLVEKVGLAEEILARSSEKSWLFDIDDSFLVEPQMLPQPDGDFAGPQDLVATVEGEFASLYADKPIPSDESGAPAVSSIEKQSPKTRVAVVGTSTWISDAMRNALGQVFIANLIDWLDNDERLIGIRSRNIINRPVEAESATTRNAVKYGNMFGLPLLFAAYGVVRWTMRQRKKRRGPVALGEEAA